MNFITRENTTGNINDSSSSINIDQTNKIITNDISSSGDINGISGTYSGNVSCSNLTTLSYSPASLSVNSFSGTTGSFSGDVITSGSQNITLDNSARLNFQSGNYGLSNATITQTTTSGVIAQVQISTFTMSGISGDPTSSTNAIQINRDGYYGLYGRLVITTNAQTGAFQQRISVAINGVDQTSKGLYYFSDIVKSSAASGQHLTLVFKFLWHFAQNDIISLNYFQNSGANQSLSGSAARDIEMDVIYVSG
jgi:hypothetical protein